MSTNRNIFERNAFEEFMSKIQQNNQSSGQNGGMNLEMFKIREEAIKFREQVEKKCIDKMYKNNEITPRTY